MSLLSLLQDRLDDDAIRRMSDQIGAEPSKTRRAVNVALPLLVGALSRNAKKSDAEAESLNRALEQDHDGTVLDDVSSVIDLASRALGKKPASADGCLGAVFSMIGSGGGATSAGSAPQKAVDGGGILRHLLGSRRSAVMAGIAKLTGLSQRQAETLLAILAPLVMGALAKRKQEENLDATGVADVLDRERAEIEETTDGLQKGRLTDLLDRNDDGAVADDIVDIGKKLRRLF